MIITSGTRAAAQTAAPAANQTTNAAPAAMGEQFMQLLLAQLRNQNPLEPMDNSEFMGQMTQLNSLQELQKMNDSLTRLVNLVEAEAVATTQKDAA